MNSERRHAISHDDKAWMLREELVRLRPLVKQMNRALWAAAMVIPLSEKAARGLIESALVASESYVREQGER